MCSMFLNDISCRRTGVPLNIKARKDSHGFENIDDYFPDSGTVIIIIYRYFFIFYYFFLPDTCKI